MEIKGLILILGIISLLITAGCLGGEKEKANEKSEEETTEKILPSSTLAEFSGDEEIEEKEEALPEQKAPEIEDIEPLPNGITVGNLNIVLTEMKRKTHLSLKVAVRKMGNIKDDFKISFAVVDDHNSTYTFGRGNSREPYLCEIGNGIGRESSTYGRFYRENGGKIKAVPIGFTWIEPICSIKVPPTAPLTKLKVSSPGEETIIIDISAFKPVEIKDFHSQVKNENFISLPYTLVEKEYFSAVMHKIKRGEDDLVIPITLKNTDYKSSGFSLKDIGVQTSEGEIWWGYYSGYTLPSARVKAEVPGLSEKTIEMHFSSGTKTILFTKLPDKSSKNMALLKVSPENFE